MRSDPPIHFHSVALRVHDVKRSASFYCRVFGLASQPATPPSPTIRVCSPPARTGCTKLTIILVQGLPSGAQPIGMDHLSLQVERAEDVMRGYRRALAAEAEATAPRWYGGRYQTYIFDPDGYKIEVLSNSGPDRDDSDNDTDESGRVADRDGQATRPGASTGCRGPPRRPFQPADASAGRCSPIMDSSGEDHHAATCQPYPPSAWQHIHYSLRAARTVRIRLAQTPRPLRQLWSFPTLPPGVA